MPLDPGLRAEFAAESEEHLDTIEATLSRGGTDRPTVDALFRAFHSLKGMSDAVGAGGMKALAHRAEDALGAARKGELALDAAALPLLAAADALRAARAALLNRDEDLPAPQPVLDALAALLGAPAPLAAKPAAPAPAAPRGDPLKASLLGLLLESAPRLAAGEADPDLAFAAREVGLPRLARALEGPMDLPAIGRLWAMLALLAEQAGEPLPALPQPALPPAPVLQWLAAAPDDMARARDAADAAHALGDAAAETALRRVQDLAFRAADADARAMLDAGRPALAAALATGTLGALDALATPGLAVDTRLPPDFAASLSADAARRTLLALDSGQRLWRVRAVTGGAAEDEAALEFWLRGAGEVLGSMAVPGAATPQLDLLLASAAEEEALRAALTLADPEARHVLSLQPAALPPPEPATPASLHPTLRVRQEVVDNIITLAAEVRAAAAALSEVLKDPSGPAAHATLAALEYRLEGEPARQIANASAQLRRLRNRVSSTESRMTLSMRQLDEAVLELRVVPLGTLFQRLPRAVRAVAEGAGKPVRLEMSGEDVRIDRSLIEMLADPLLHLVRNAVDHGVEPPGQRGTKPEEAVLSVSAQRLPGQVRIVIADDGRGIDAAAVRRTAEARGLIPPGTALSEAATHALLLRPGFSTKAEVTEVSGRGVGLDVVHDAVRRAGGHMAIGSRPGEGTSFTLTLPVSAAIQPVLLVEAGGHAYGLPAGRVVEVLPPGAEAEGLSLVTLEAALGLPEAPPGGTVVLDRPAGRLGLTVERVAQRTDLLLRPLHPSLAALPALSAVGMLGTGEPVLVLEPDGLG
ncbi:hypothetical protein EOD42_03815 [Rhodovarius crocodyli]|uniref:Chemotaxis protein CheA n=1 Tax=Rhodovarius crocodyli TaxID=1979269 RepID=A0A437MNM7_9PROT|nr:ATP-binding protein [Rhodovarius crocodyli]RVT99237.1 hypothetical protein EOD42_03815 [Rhodovarius crocodyli]